MKSPRSAAALCLVIAAAAVWAGCSSSSDAGGATPADEQDATGACKVFFVKENRFLTGDELAKLGDPVAKKVLQGKGGCPTSLNEISAKLAKTDATKCVGGGGGGGNTGPFPPIQVDGGPTFSPPSATAGVSTRFVSDRSQVLLTPDSYRAVITRECDGTAITSSSSRCSGSARPIRRSPRTSR